MLVNKKGSRPAKSSSEGCLYLACISKYFTSRMIDCKFDVGVLAAFGNVEVMSYNSPFCDSTYDRMKVDLFRGRPEEIEKKVHYSDTRKHWEPKWAVIVKEVNWLKSARSENHTKPTSVNTS